MDLHEKFPEISLYFHIPFCTKKCDYCHFYVLPDKDPFKKQLMQGFRLEWARWLAGIQGKNVVSVYFGGGTPALIGAEAIAEILSWIPLTNNAEITLEANPENVSPELMRAYAQAGINRISIGIQTFDQILLKKLGRIHSAKKGIEAVEATQASGIENISIDLMYDLPGQSLEAWRNTLKVARELPITHLSLYNLTIEPHTVFFKYRDAIQKQIPDEQVSLSMYESAIEMLNDAGLKQYEISAFARNNAFALHNTGYWTARPFLGFGPSAFSYWEGKRFRNVANLNKYCQALEKGESPIDFEEKLDAISSRRELLVIQLRLLEGLNLTNFQNSHGSLDEETLKNLEELTKNSYIEHQNGIFKLTKHGILFYDELASQLI